MNSSLIISQKKKINLGIQILRLLLSFNIIAYHFLSAKYQTKLIFYICLYYLAFYVPTFFLISFYYSFNAFTSKFIEKLKERILRLLIPYIIWPVIDSLAITLMHYLNKTDRKITFKMVYYQLIIGREINPPFYFQFNLILMTLLFIIIIFSFTNYIHIMLGLFILVILVHYFCNINEFFEGFSYIINHSIKKIFYSIIYSITGFLLGKVEVLEHLKRKRIESILISSVCLSVFFIYPKILSLISNLEVIPIDFFAINIFILFGLLPFDLIHNEKIILYIKKLTSVTGGIYYIHWNVGFLIIKNLKFIRDGSFTSCVMNFIFCYIFCFLCLKLFNNSFLKYLFI